MKDRFVYPNAMLHTSRTKFPMHHTHKTTMLHSGLYPIDIIEVVPGDTFELKVASLIRMSNPIFPIMDNIEMHVAAYFIPFRLLWENYEEFEGVNKTGAWFDAYNSYTEVPCLRSTGIEADPYAVRPGSILEMLGLPVGAVLNGDASANDPSALSMRGYYILWNEQYRNANVSAPIPVNRSDSDYVIGTLDYEDLLIVNGANTYFNSSICLVDTDDDDYYTGIMKVAKFADVFTKCLPAPQRGASVEYIPDLIGPVITGTRHTLPTSPAPVTYKNLSGTDVNSSGVLGVYNGKLSQVQDAPGFDINEYYRIPDNLYAQINQVGATINDLRILFQIQKYLEKDGRYGLKNLADKTLGHFGVRSPDGVLQMAQFLGEANFRINVEQVLSTAGAADDSTSKLGQPGANSVTAGKCDLGTHSFTERGYIYIVAAARHQHTYGNGYLPYLLHKELYDFYDPLFANIGDMPVRKILLGNSDMTNLAIFGYQEPFYEYRFLQDRVTGYVNPAASTGLDMWTLADDFSKFMPSLNEAFIYENRNSISRCLVSGSKGPDYVCDWYFMHTAVRPMPLFGIPGLVDHH